MLSSLPDCWESAVIGRSAADGTVTIGSITAEAPLIQLRSIPARLAEAGRVAGRRFGAVRASLRQLGERLVNEVAHIGGRVKAAFNGGIAGSKETLMDTSDQ